MITRHDREDYTEQIDRLATARADLGKALASLSAEAKSAWRAVASPKGTPDLLAVYAATEAVRRAEEDVDTRTHDLATAMGEHA